MAKKDSVYRQMSKLMGQRELLNKSQDSDEISEDTVSKEEAVVSHENGGEEASIKGLK